MSTSLCRCAPVATMLLLAAPAQGSAATPTIAAADTLAATCRRVWGVRADGSNLAKFPTNFPPPPAGARRCAARASVSIVYYIWDVPAEEVFRYWEQALAKRGYTVKRMARVTRGRWYLQFGPSPRHGRISVSPKGGGFSVLLGTG